MTNADVTITLGRSGQKVVKRSGGVGGGARTDSRTFSGSKRSLEDTFGSKADGSLLFANKRVRGDDNSRSSGCNSLSGARIGRDDLRLKLTRKRMYQSQRMIEVRKKTSRAKYSEQSERSSVRSIPLTRSANELRRMDLERRADDLRRMDSLKSSYSSQTSAGLGLTSPVTVGKASPGISAARYINETQLVPSERRVEASGTRRVVSGDVNPSQLRVPVSMPTSISLDACKPVTGLPTSSSMLRSSQPDASLLTVSSFLHSLGLGKYAINFQAEEVDMTALKQMGDRDLKELGLPMGPRKKILLAMLPPSKRSTA